MIRQRELWAVCKSEPDVWNAVACPQPSLQPSRLYRMQPDLIWLLASAASAHQLHISLPRRLLHHGGARASCCSRRSAAHSHARREVTSHSSAFAVSVSRTTISVEQVRYLRCSITHCWYLTSYDTSCRCHLPLAFVHSDTLQWSRASILHFLLREILRTMHLLR